MRIGKISTYIKTFTMGLAATTAVSCRGPLHKVKPDKELACVIDSFNKENSKITKDTTYKMFGVDTLLINTVKLSKLTKYLNNKAASSVQDTTAGSYVTMVPMYIGKSIKLMPQVETIYKKLYINAKAVADTNIFSTKNGDLYLPVKYYGQKNPELLNAKE